MRSNAGWLCLIGLLAGCGGATEPSPEKLAAETPKAAVISKNSVPAEATQVAGPDAADAVPALEVNRPDGVNVLTRGDLEAGWIKLFDGHTLFGWKANSETPWRVEEGVIIADSGDKGLLVTTTQFADYELQCDFRVEDGGNSGIFLRTPFEPKDPAVDCYELNMCDTHPEFGTASLVKRGRPEMPVIGDGEWHSFHVRLEGPVVTVQMDGKPVLEYRDETSAPLTSGFIGLQRNAGKVEFRNVFLKPLGTTDLFDGQSLSGWRVVPGSKSEFTAADGEIRVVNGRGFLETERTAANFLLQFEAKTDAEKLNSGVFFRAQAGTEAEPSNGYEFQIQNGFKDGDRNQPEDHGTGAIFRRISARRVVANDNEWLSATLVADGPHVATWVNGIQVVDWTDDRVADSNPRKGLSLAAGHFSLQGHDPTTKLAFRKLKLVELP